MDELRELEKRLRVAEDVEAIRKLKAKYCRCNDKKLWDDLGDCFARDAVLEVPSYPTRRGRGEILKFLEEVQSSVIVVHQVHQSEIEITSEASATGVWGMFNQIINSGGRSWSLLYGFYVEEYIKEEGEWRINNERIDYIYSKRGGIYKGAERNRG